MHEDNQSRKNSGYREENDVENQWELGKIVHSNESYEEVSWS